MLQKITLLLIGCFFSMNLLAQELSGVIRDAVKNQPVFGATIRLKNARMDQQTTSDQSGLFSFENLQYGYYTLEVIAQGYENQTITEIEVKAARDVNIELSLQPSSIVLNELPITYALPSGRRPLQSIGEIPLSRDQTLRLPSMYFDPARLAAAYPGVAQTEDGTNALNIRGNSPSSVRWRLEGTEIVNPNHLPNAGTFSDGPAAASGGVLMFSAQMLDNSSLLTGSLPAGYGDAIGGIFDMNLRTGNATRHQFTAQAGLVGLDVAAEGPIGKKSTYLANYRYSTVGILGKMGVSFGGEKINFQDGAFHVKFNQSGRYRVSLFGMVGKSENTFQHTEDSSKIESYKELLDIYFNSKTVILGISNFLKINDNNWLKVSASISRQKSRRSDFNAYDFKLYNSYQDARENRTSINIQTSHQLTSNFRLTTGAVATFNSADYETNDNRTEVRLYYHDDLTVIMQPWVNTEWTSMDRKSKLIVGVHTLLNEDNEDPILEPRLIWNYRTGKKSEFSLSGGLVSQMKTYLFWSERMNNPAPLPYPEFFGFKSNKLVKGQQAAAKFRYINNRLGIASAEIFYQHLDNILQSRGAVGNGFSGANLSENTPIYNPIYSNSWLSFTGAQRSAGLELSLSKQIESSWYWLANATLMRSQTLGSDNIWRRSRWDLGHIVNLTAGREWNRKLKNPDKVKRFGFGLRAIWTGGGFDVALPEYQNPYNLLSTYSPYPEYTTKLPDYFRLDGRVYWKRNLTGKRNSTFAMEFQNMTYQQNVGYRYYEPYTGKITTKYQQGFIPNISWRLEF